MTTTAMVKQGDARPTALEYTEEQRQMVRDTYANGANDQEFAVLMEIARRRNLDPLTRQIWFIKRWDAQKRKEVWACQTSIDGLRVIAQRTGLYDGQDEPELEFRKDGAPLLARVRVYRKDWSRAAVGVAYWDEYAQRTKDGAITHMWKEKGRHMLAKCFDEHTEVLTDRGFQRFEAVTGRVLMVTGSGLQPCDAKPFAQPYAGDMVVLDSDDLNFAVTPNHDMVTTAGKVEAQLLYERARARPQFWIPRCVGSTRPDATSFSDTALQLSAAYIADGYDATSGFRIEVSRSYKIAALREIGGYERESVRECAGDVAIGASGREIVTRSDKLSLRYPREALEWFVGVGKVLRADDVMGLSRRQARLLVDTMLEFDGSDNGVGVRRFYTSRDDHAAMFELAAVVAGYSVSARRERFSDLSDRPNYVIAVSDRNEIPVIRWGRDYQGHGGNARHRTGLETQRNQGGRVWCVTVPSGIIVVRRHGFSMLCGNCAEALALRKAFPEDMSGLYTEDEIDATPREEPARTQQQRQRPKTIGQPVREAQQHDPETGEVNEAGVEDETMWTDLAMADEAALEEVDDELTLKSLGAAIKARGYPERYRVPLADKYAQIQARLRKAG